MTASVRILGIETSSRRGSVALVDGDSVVACALNEQSTSHGEVLLSLIDRVMATAGFRRSDLDRLAVGVGPGSFTGLRVGVALAHGIALGLDRPLVGVGSLAAMSAAVPTAMAGLRAAILDARRGEVFLGLFDSAGAALAGPEIVNRANVLDCVRARAGGRETLLVGEEAVLLLGDGRHPLYRAPEADLPHAAWVARLAASAPLLDGSAEPLYVRDADAVKPALPASPFG